MADKEFREFLVSKIDTLKASLADPNTPVDQILITASEINRLTNRVNRIDNPVPRKPRTPKAPE